MKLVFAGLSVVAILSGMAFGQSANTTAKFEVADVHTSVRVANSTPTVTGGVLRGERYDLKNASMLDLIKTAWNVGAATVVGGPNWLEKDRFDVIAKAPRSTPPETIRLMLQSLLIDRFSLTVHRDTRPMKAFAITAGKNKSKLREATGAGAAGCDQPQNSQAGTVASVTVSCRNITMEAFAQGLRGRAGDYLTSPVVDATGLKGAWDFELKWNTRSQLPQAGPEGITIFDAVDKQLGLKLELQEVQMPVLVVDSVNEEPTANAPGVADALPSGPPAEFEVADIKLSKPDTKAAARVRPGGRLELEGYTLKMLMKYAWNISGDDMVVGGPKWVDSTKYNIVGKVPAAPGQANVSVDPEDLRLMLRSLLMDRFKLAVHNETRSVSTYALLAAEPKLTKADPSNRSACKDAPAAQKDPRIANPALSRFIACQNTTMAEFAEQLQGLAPGYIRNPVVDATGLNGAWDFTLAFSRSSLLQSGTAQGDDVTKSAGVAADPNGALSVPDAIRSQLGLRLELQKRPLPVLVIDHVEETTEN